MPVSVPDFPSSHSQEYRVMADPPSDGAVQETSSTSAVVEDAVGALGVAGTVVTVTVCVPEGSDSPELFTAVRYTV